MDKTIEERLADLEAVAHIHNPVKNIIENRDCDPDRAWALREKMDAQHEQDLQKEDVDKAKKKGGLFGDPFFVVE